MVDNIFVTIFILIGIVGCITVWKATQYFLKQIDEEQSKAFDKLDLVVRRDWLLNQLETALRASKDKQLTFNHLVVYPLDRSTRYQITSIRYDEEYQMVSDQLYWTKRIDKLQTKSLERIVNELNT